VIKFLQDQYLWRACMAIGNRHLW